MVPLFRGVPLMLRWYSVGILGCFAGAPGNVKLFRGVPLFRRCFVFHCSVFRRSWFYSVPFNTLALKKVSCKTKIFLKKLEYRFSIQSTTNESTTFPYKTTLSKANVKTNSMGNTNWTCHKKWTFATDYFIFLKILFEYKNVL